MFLDDVQTEDPKERRQSILKIKQIVSCVDMVHRLATPRLEKKFRSEI